MCGIVGYIGPRDATPIVLDGLRRLEYRGYDSAGIACVNAGAIDIRRAEGKLSRLAKGAGRRASSVITDATEEIVAMHAELARTVSAGLGLRSAR